VPTPPHTDLPTLDAATNRLVRTLEALSDADIARPSLLPGWTVGHVATHIARNADGLVRLVTWARTGVVTPMYDSMASREADIAGGADRPAAEILADVVASAARVRAAFVELTGSPEPVLERLVVFGAPPPGTAPDTPARTIPFRRLQEVEVHHVDLGLDSYGPQDWPADFVERQLLFLHSRSGAVDVVGDPAEVLFWRMGRGTGPSVTRMDGSDPGPAPAW
jgi:maleylpyruvate isomerase